MKNKLEMPVSTGEGTSHVFRGDDPASRGGNVGGSTIQTEDDDIFQTEGADDFVDEGY